jgi:hypothetical protein
VLAAEDRLAMVRGGRAWPLFIAPVLWSLIGLQAAFLFGVYPDLGLGVAGLAGVALALRSRVLPSQGMVQERETAGSRRS